jgi:murein DD-endopeptidase MepM/ murein hydrolase activator NlpD
LKRRKDKHFTIAVSPERSGRTRYFVVTRRKLWLAACASVALVVGGVTGSLWGVGAWHRTAPSAPQSAQQTALTTELMAARERLGELSDRLQRLDELESRLLDLAHLSDPGRQLAIGPVDPALTQARDPGDHPLLEDARTRLLNEGLIGIVEEADAQAARLEALERHFDAARARLAATPSRRPATGWMTSRFGVRHDPMTGVRKMHSGIDVASAIGTPIITPADAVVAKVHELSGYGLTVLLDHGFGIMTMYAHLADAQVKAGDRVNRGDRIGSIGMSGRSTGPHLHYEVLVDGMPVDPERFILD